MIGSWSGESRYTPAFATNPKPADETSAIDCEAAFKATHIRCHIRFHRKSDGRLRVVEHNINKHPAKPGFNVTLLDAGSHGQPRYTLEWSESHQAWIGYLPTDHDGQPATEKIMDKPSADRSTIVHTESIRLNATPNAPWTETFRWTGLVDRRTSSRRLLVCIWKSRARPAASRPRNRPIF